jgi:3-oxoacyl-[acyl-carrier-protein] synthase II
MGAVSPLGWGVPATWDGLLAGRCGLGPIRRFDATPFRSAGGGEVPDDPRAAMPEGRLRAEHYLIEAVREALAEAGASPAETALVVGTNFGGMAAAERALAGGDARALGAYEFGAQLSRCARELGIGAPRAAISLSCASGTAALVLARDLIEAGRAERVVAAGFDELSRYVFAGLAALRAMSPTGLRPFDLKRDGTLFSEGAGALVVEEATAARARGARIRAVVAGGALTNDGYHMTAPEKEATGIRALMRGALASAGLAPADIDHVNLHGTGTKYNDLIETVAMKDVFGDRAREIPVTANKAALGHAMGAAGSLETIAAVKSMNEGRIPPTLGLEEQDPECDLDVVRGGPREVRIDALLKTSYGIGGTNAAVVLSKEPDGGL